MGSALALELYLQLHGSSVSLKESNFETCYRPLSTENVLLLGVGVKWLLCNCIAALVPVLMGQGVFSQRETCSGKLCLYVCHNEYCYLFVCQITGGSSGIGKCLAAGAIKRGAAVVTLVARNKVSSIYLLERALPDR